MHQLVEFLAHLDWFERVDEIGRAVAGQRSWRFEIPRDCGRSGQQIEDMLKSFGIPIWGRNFNRTSLFFRVKRKQANWAEYLLWRHSIPVASKPFNPANAKQFSPPAQKRQKPDEMMAFVEQMRRTLDSIL